MQTKLSVAALERLKQLRESYRKAKDQGDSERMAQCVYMAKSIKSGGTTFIYDLPLK